MTPSVQRLRAEVAFDRDTFQTRVAELESISLEPGAAGAAGRAQAAVALHHAYGSLESVMVRATRFLEGELPQGPDWHQGLLHGMALEVESVRPAVFSSESYPVLRSLLGFRDFFRHAYAVELDVGRLARLREELVSATPRILTELQAFEAFLGEVSAAGDRQGDAG